MLPNGTGYGEITAQSPYYGFAQETATGTPVCPSNFHKWLDGSMTDEDCELEPFEPDEECKAIREAREIIERELTP